MPQLSVFWISVNFTKHCQVRKCKRETQSFMSGGVQDQRRHFEYARLPQKPLPHTKNNRITRHVNKDRIITIIVLKFLILVLIFLCLQLAVQNTSIFFHRVKMWRFLTGVKPPPQKKAKLSETDAGYEKEKRRQK